MAADEKWYFTKEHLANTPSRKCGYDADRELSCRQQAANFIQDMGQRLQVTQLCINTAIVYMHRFYVFHSFTQFHRNAMAAAALFLAAKVEEQPRKLEHVIKVAQMCLHREQPPLDTKSELFNDCDFGFAYKHFAHIISMYPFHKFYRKDSRKILGQYIQSIETTESEDEELYGEEIKEDYIAPYNFRDEAWPMYVALSGFQFNVPAEVYRGPPLLLDKTLVKWDVLLPRFMCGRDFSDTFKISKPYYNESGLIEAGLSELYLEQAQDLVMNENVLLQTLGFDVAIDHPHTHVVRCCHLVRASKDLAQTSYFMASNSLHLTTMCLQYKPTVVACFCIHLACKWSNWEIPQSNEGKSWFWYVDRSVTQELLEQLTDEFLRIFDKCPSRLKRKIMSISANQNPTLLSGYPFPADGKREGQNKQGLESGQPTFHQPIQQAHCSSAYRSRSTASASLGSAEEAKKRLESNVLQSHQRPLPDYKKMASSGHHSSRDPAYGLGYHSSSSSQSTSSSSTSSSSSSSSSSQSTSSSSSLTYGQNICSQSSIISSQSFGINSQMISNQICSSSSQYNQGQSTKTSLGHLIDSTPLLPSNKIGNGSRQECMFPPPMRSHHGVSRLSKPESQSSAHHVSQYKQPYPPSHHPPRNGTNRVQESNKIPMDTKHFSEGKSLASHQKSHVKSYYSTGISSVSSASYGSNNRFVTSESKVKSEQLSPPQFLHPSLLKMKNDPLSPPQPSSSHFKLRIEPLSPPQPYPSHSAYFPASLPPPPPPPLPVSLPQPTHVKSIFSPEKVSPVSAPAHILTPPPPPPPLPPPPPPPPPSVSPTRELKSCLPVLTSPLKSPNTSHKSGRNRTSSSSSEPELIPVVQKLEEMSGFETIGKGLKTAIKLPSKVPDLIHSSRDRKKEVVSVNKELKHTELSHSVPTVNITETSVTEYSDTKESKESKSHKKKKKHKEHREHKEHKEKDKDRDRDGKKQKHKEKHREKHKDPAPIKITIPKDKLNHILAFPPNTSPVQESSSSLKIKIPKERLVQQPQSGLKIKISKDVIAQSTNKDILPPVSSSRKRERSSHTEAESSAPPQKMSRGSSSRPNGYSRTSGSEVNFPRQSMPWNRSNFPKYPQHSQRRVCHPQYPTQQPIVYYQSHPPPVSYMYNMYPSHVPPVPYSAFQQIEGQCLPFPPLPEEPPPLPPPPPPPPPEY